MHDSEQLYSYKTQRPTYLQNQTHKCTHKEEKGEKFNPIFLAYFSQSELKFSFRVFGSICLNLHKTKI